MSSERLINGIVQQTMVLIAQVATTAGARAPLAHLANRVFLDLTEALAAQGLTRKVIADMFGLALRSWQQKLSRLQARSDHPEQSLWEALYNWLGERPSAARMDVLAAFRQEDDATVRGLLNDLVESGLVSLTGRGDSAVYRRLTDRELAVLAAEGPEVDDALVWRTVYEHGPVSAADIEAHTALDPDRVGDAIDRLADEQRIVPDAGGEGEGEAAWRASVFVLPMEPGPAWEVALLDHHQAVVSALVAKLRAVATRPPHFDRMGGSTFRFDIHDAHPHAEEVLGQLAELRQRTAELWDRVQQHNQENPPADRAPGRARVTVYFGQGIVAEEEA